MPIKFLITKRQQNILYMFGIVALTIIIVFIFIYAPKETQVKKLKVQFKSLEESLTNIHSIVGIKEDLGKGILRLRSDAADTEAKFVRPDNIGELLQMLSAEARSRDIEVVSTQPSEFSTCYAKAKGSALQFDGFECNKISIEMNVVGSYRSLIDYMDTLENKQTLQLVVERFNIERQDNPSRLRAYIVINAFALLPVKASQ